MEGDHGAEDGIHHPDRFKVLFVLGSLGAVSVEDVMKYTGLTAGDLSVQLERLIEADYVDERRVLFRTRVGLTGKGVQELRRFLARVESSLARADGADHGLQPGR